MFKVPTRKQMRLIWAKVSAGKPLPVEDMSLAQVMHNHPEYADLWPRIDKLSRKQIERDGGDPILHIALHQAIEKQISDQDPQETSEAIKAFMRQGLSRHEAIHRVLLVLADEAWNVLAKDKPFDQVRYVRKLRKLAEEPNTPKLEKAPRAAQSRASKGKST
jgi:uncharacterized protein YoaH (UPF0181 family)